MNGYTWWVRRGFFLCCPIDRNDWSEWQLDKELIAEKTFKFNVRVVKNGLFWFFDQLMIAMPLCVSYLWDFDSINIPWWECQMSHVLWISTKHELAMFCVLTWLAYVLELRNNSSQLNSRSLFQGAIGQRIWYWCCFVRDTTISVGCKTFIDTDRDWRSWYEYEQIDGW